MNSSVDRLLAIQNQVAEATRRAGRPADSVELMAVSKNFSAEKVREVVDAGQVLFGENRVQEAESKIPDLPSKLRWHLIGHLQSNKVRRALPLFEVIHSVDSLELARQIQRVATELGLFPKVYLQANLARESSKYGFTREDFDSQYEEILQLDRLQVLGLMAIPPVRANSAESRADFVALRTLRDQLEVSGGVPLPGLSMGMSSDFPIAIEEGATIVRVGSALFGERG